jgi:hypothetical protein
MYLHSFKLIVATLLMLLLAACGGGSAAPAASGLTAKASESAVTVTWDMAPGVEYWLFCVPTSIAPADVSSMSPWISLSVGGAKINVTSPYVVSGLANGISYTFSVNGRIDRGPGGPGATPKAATPTLAGSTWTAGAAAAGSNSLRSVMLGSTYVAAGLGGAMYSSLDGSTWAAIATTNAGTTDLNGAAFLSTYKVVGNGGLVLTSSDAVTWTAQTTGTTNNLYAIASNSLLNVAVGANGTIITSPDGITWTSRTSTTTQALYGVTYSAYNVGTYTAGTWVAVGAANTLLESADGVTWTAVTLPASSADLRGITYGASTFVAVGTSGTVLSSTDGMTWTARSTPVTANLNAVSYGNQFVTVGAGGNAFTSADGVTWTNSDSATKTSNALYAVVRGSTLLVAVGDSGINLVAK